MIEYVNATDGGYVEVYLARSPAIAGGMVDVTVRPKYGSEAALALYPGECRELAAALTRAAEEAEGA